MNEETKPATDEYIGALMLGLHDIEAGPVGMGTMYLVDSLKALIARIRSDRTRVLELEAEVEVWRKIAGLNTAIDNVNARLTREIANKGKGLTGAMVGPVAVDFLV